MSTKSLTIPVPSRRIVVATLLVLLAVIVGSYAWPAVDAVYDVQRCADGGCADELPGQWSNSERTITLNDDGTFVARGDGRLMRGTWDAYERQICFRSAGEIECLAYQYMGKALVLDGETYGRR